MRASLPARRRGVPPEIMGIGPVPAIQAVVEKAGLKLADIDRFEINEAFGAQVMACARALALDEDKLNVNGGAIAIGHPLGATGVRLSVTLARELKRSGLRYGIASACIGGGQGIALLIENMEARKTLTMDIKGHAAIVTGGGSGLGAATAEALAKAGAKVALLDVNMDAANAHAAKIGGIAVKCDVSDSASAEAAVKEASAKHGVARILVNCAGIGKAGRIVGREGPMPLGNYELIIKVNLIGTFNLLRLFAADCSKTEPLAAANAASWSTPPRSRPSTARSGRRPIRPPRAASSASRSPPRASLRSSAFASAPSRRASS